MINPLIKYNQLQKDIFVEVHTADLHFGNNAIDPSIEYNLLVEQMIIPLESLNFDILSINGDFFDHKVMANSDTAMYGCMFTDVCVDICRRKRATLIIILGTDSHDAGQLKLFYHYLSDPTVDVRIVEQAKFEVVNGKRILCLPEEYGKGSKYYENLLYYSGWYDAVYMHGTIKGSIFGADKMDLDNDRAVFDIENFIYCKGPIISGHVHTPMCLKGYMYYVGCPIRYKFGEEEDKGYTILVHNIRTREFYTHFQDIQSFRYDTINLDHMIQQDPKIIIDYIKSLQTQGIQNIRIEFTIDAPTIDILKSFYRTNSTIKIKDDRNKMTTNLNGTSVDSDDDYPEEYDKYQFLLDPSTNEYEKLVKYINLNKGYTYITTEELIDLLEGED